MWSCPRGRFPVHLGQRPECSCIRNDATVSGALAAHSLSRIFKTLGAYTQLIITIMFTWKLINFLYQRYALVPMSRGLWTWCPGSLSSPPLELFLASDLCIAWSHQACLILSLLACSSSAPLTPGCRFAGLSYRLCCRKDEGQSAQTFLRFLPHKAQTHTHA